MNLFHSQDVLALCDFETTGVDYNLDRPIEVGILFLDSELRVIGAYESFIHPVEWSDSHWGAFRVHRIPPIWLTGAPEAKVVAGQIWAACDRVKQARSVRRFVLCSDNAVFETAFMRRLFVDCELEWPFYRTTWDTNFLVKACGLDGVVPQHRAMADVGLELEALLKCKAILEGKR